MSVTDSFVLPKELNVVPALVVSLVKITNAVDNRGHREKVLSYNRK